MYSYCYVYVFLLVCMFRSVYSVSLCCSVYCLCVNVYCHRLSTQLQLKKIYHINGYANASLCYVVRPEHCPFTVGVVSFELACVAIKTLHAAIKTISTNTIPFCI